MYSNLKKIALVFVLALITVSCGSDGNSKDASKKNADALKPKTDITFEWTAFKKTEKIAVKGTFKQIEFASDRNKKSLEEIISSTSFKIATNSIYSANEARDAILSKFFFGVMADTENILGKFINAKDGVGVMSIKMNDRDIETPFKYIMKNDTLSINTVLMLDNWNVEQAISSLNEKCHGEHTGSDGISKTWTDVNISVKIPMAK